MVLRGPTLILYKMFILLSINNVFYTSTTKTQFYQYRYYQLFAAW